jgi:transcriptional regulator with XRE-family HTH domain
MIGNSQYYFDTLPLRHRPERFETFTSYLMRLAESNGFQSTGRLAAACAFDWRPDKLKDHPPLSFGTLQTAATCPTSTLLGTTFYYLVRRFGRSSLPQSSARFLSESIAQYLRFCPKCLSHRLYYPLTWRFYLVQGCSEHQCCLLDSCGHCGHLIPIFKNTGRLGVCPACNGMLSECPAPLMTEEVYRKTLSSVRELEFLLSPQTYEVDSESASKCVAASLAHLRRAQHLTIREAASQMGMQASWIEELERGSNRAGPFDRSVRYAAFLGTTLYTIFRYADLRSFRNPIERVKKFPISEDSEVERVRWAIMYLKENEQPPTQTAIVELAQISQPHKINNPQVKDLLKQAAIDVRSYLNERRRAQSEEVYAQIQRAIEQLVDLEQPVTEKNICRIIGISKGQLSRLKGFPAIQSLLEMSIKQYRTRLKDHAQLEEYNLKIEVKAAIEQLQAKRQRLTRSAISEIVGVPASKLNSYAQIKDLFTRSVPTTRQYRFQEDKLIEEIEGVVQQLKESRQIITQRAIAKLIGISPSGLRFYPRAKALIDQYASWYHYYERRQRGKVGDELVAKVEDAIDQLRTNGLPVTQYAIGSVLEISLYFLKSYPQVRALLEQFEEGYSEHRSEQALLREEALLVRVQAATAHFISRNEAVTSLAVSKAIEVSTWVLSYYPRVRAFLKNEMLNESNHRIMQEQMREDILVLELLEAVEFLTQQGKRISMRAITRMVGSPRNVLESNPRTKAILDQVVPKSKKRSPIEMSPMSDLLSQSE